MSKFKDVKSVVGKALSEVTSGKAAINQENKVDNEVPIKPKVNKPDIQEIPKEKPKEVQKKPAVPKANDQLKLVKT